MALKTEKPPEASVAASPMPNTTVLELALYKIYTWGPNHLRKGQAVSVQECRCHDAAVRAGSGTARCGRFTSPTVQAKPRSTEIVDATMIAAPIPVDMSG